MEQNENNKYITVRYLLALVIVFVGFLVVKGVDATMARIADTECKVAQKVDKEQYSKDIKDIKGMMQSQGKTMNNIVTAIVSHDKSTARLFKDRED